MTLPSTPERLDAATWLAEVALDGTYLRAPKIRPKKAKYISYIAYIRVMEEYCDELEEALVFAKATENKLLSFLSLSISERNSTDD